MAKQKWRAAKQAINKLYDVWHDGALALHSNEAINPIAKAALSPVAMIGEMYHTGNIIDPITNTYMKTAVKDEAGKIVLQDGVNAANIAGSMFTAGVGMGVARGLTHDASGNTDIAGIPFI